MNFKLHINWFPSNISIALQFYMLIDFQVNLHANWFQFICQLDSNLHAREDTAREDFIRANDMHKASFASYISVLEHGVCREKLVSFANDFSCSSTK